MNKNKDNNIISSKNKTIEDIKKIPKNKKKEDSKNNKKNIMDKEDLEKKEDNKSNILIKSNKVENNKVEKTIDNNINKEEIKIPLELLSIFDTHVSNISKKKLKKYKKKINNILKIHVFASYNNILASLVNEDKVIFFSSGGKLKFRNTQKSSPYVSELLAKLMSSIILYLGDKRCKIILSGPGYIKNNFVTWMMKYVQVIYVEEKVKYVFNGTRPKNPRKV